MFERISWLRPVCFLVVLFYSMIFPKATESYSVSPVGGGGASNSNDHHLIFSLKEYQKECAKEAFQSLDASRLHFQVLFVDDDNAKGRIAEGLLAQIAEYNDAMCVLFPASATLSASTNAPRDAAASRQVLSICNSLGLCSSRSEQMGTDFDLTYLDEYDLVVCLDETIRSCILRSLPSEEDQDYYRPRCRLLSEFLSPSFVISLPQTIDSSESLMTIASEGNVDTKMSDDSSNHIRPQWDMLETSYQDRILPYAEQVLDRSSSLFTNADMVHDWPLVESGIILASGGIVRFCLDTIQVQLETALGSLLKVHLHQKEHLDWSWEDVDGKLRRSNSVVTGYFSPEQRRVRFEEHKSQLRASLYNETTTATGK